MPSCNIFQEKIAAFAAECEAIASLLATYPALGAQEILDEMKERHTSTTRRTPAVLGMDDRGVSFILGEQNTHLQEQLEQLCREGSLKFSGRMRVFVM